uniref:Uncharacterized protein n=1 Tax=Anguilla anguilla TaxID=7936 RepID=A0A0E9UQ20_ANGAN
MLHIEICWILQNAGYYSLLNLAKLNRPA